LNEFSIIFDNVTLRYDDKICALKELCFKIKKGEKIILCGRTGSGKTSIINAMSGLY